MIRIEHNVQTGIVTELQLTEQEIVFALKETKEIAELAISRQAEAEAKAAARQVILDRLGLTADEAALLLG